MQENNVTPIKTKERAKAVKVPPHALTVRLPQMMEMLSVKQTKARELIMTGQVESYKLGKTRLITVSSIRRLIGEAA